MLHRKTACRKLTTHTRACHTEPGRFPPESRIQDDARKRMTVVGRSRGTDERGVGMRMQPVLACSDGLGGFGSCPVGLTLPAGSS
jgi:hypothetical protein